MTEKAAPKYCFWSKGALYFSVRLPEGGKSYDRMPTYGTPEFNAAYAAKVEAHELRIKHRKEARAIKPTAASNVISNTFKALVLEAEKTRSYREKKPRTQEAADRYYRMIVADWGDKLVADLEPADVDRRIDMPDMAPFPGKVLGYLRHLGALIDLGIRRGYRKDKYNPARKAERPEIGEHAPWPDDVYEDVIAAASPMLRLAIQLGVYTGQRISDCIRMDREVLLECARLNEPMVLIQQKTNVEVWIPIHPDLAAIVAESPASPKAKTILYNRFNKPFADPGMIQKLLKDLMIELGHVERHTVDGREKVVTTYKFHGLRKLAACHLAEVEATPHEIGSICGMSIQTVTHYTRGVAKRKLARGVTGRMNTIRPGQARPDLRLG